MIKHDKINRVLLYEGERPITGLRIRVKKTATNLLLSNRCSQQAGAVGALSLVSAYCYNISVAMAAGIVPQSCSVEKSLNSLLGGYKRRNFFNCF